jgi:hypothetical protein
VKSSKIWCVKFDGLEHRVRLPIDFAEYVSWARAVGSTGVECVATVGEWGQLQLWQAAPEEEIVRQITEGLHAMDRASGDTSVESSIQLLRMATTAWPVTISFDAKNRRYTVVLPKETRDLELAPIPNGPAVIFAAPDILEVWRAPAWVEHVRNSRRDIRQLTEAALSNLEHDMQ